MADGKLLGERGGETQDGCGEVGADVEIYDIE